MINEKCPLCESLLINGAANKRQIEYTEENLAKFNAGEISLQELNETVKLYYMQPKICACDSSPQNDYRPCPNCGKLVDTIKIYDE